MIKDRIHSVLITGVLGVLMLAALLPLLAPSLTLAAPSDLPPRPTPVPTPIPQPPPPALPFRQPSPWAAIELQAQFSPAWPWSELPWGSLWTVVHWQDSSGKWQEVKGWQGTLDEIVGGATPTHSWQGRKVWWVAEKDWGTGPFRWAIYQSQDGPVLAESEPFQLPDASGQRLIVELPLKP